MGRDSGRLDVVGGETVGDRLGQVDLFDGAGLATGGNGLKPAVWAMHIQEPLYSQKPIATFTINQCSS